MRMRVLFILFLRKFKNIRYNTPLGSFFLLLLYRLIKYFFQGTWDEVFFNWFAQRIFGNGDVVSVETIILVGIPTVGIIGILAWMYADARKEFKSTNLIDALNEMHQRMKELKNSRLAKEMNTKAFDDASEILMDRLGLIELAGC